MGLTIKAVVTTVSDATADGKGGTGLRSETETDCSC